MRRQTLLKKLVVSFILVSLIPALLTAGVTFYRNNRDLKASIISENQLSLLDISERTSEKIQQVDMFFYWVSQNTQIQQLLNLTASEAASYSEDKALAIKELRSQTSYRPIAKDMLSLFIIGNNGLDIRDGAEASLIDYTYGYRLVGEAANGQQAIEIVHREQPHIIITDMKMPVMDGLTLIKTLKNEEGFSVAFLVLSSYDDFELVKGAMKLGAVDYFLKLELDIHMLLSCLDEVRKTITSADSSCENETVGGVSALQSKVIRNIISNYFFTEEEMIKQLKQSGIHLDTDSMYCLFIKINNILIFEESTEEEYYTLNYGIINVITEISNDCQRAIMFRLGNDDQSHLPGSVASIPLKMILRLDSCVKGVSHR